VVGALTVRPQRLPFPTSHDSTRSHTVIVVAKSSLTWGSLVPRG